MSFGGKSDGGAGAAREDRLAAAEQRASEAEALAIENERADASALSEKQSLADKEAARKKKQPALSATSSDDEPASLLG